MAIVNYSGFETGDATEFQSMTGSAAVQSSIVKSGGYALKIETTATGTGLCQLGMVSAAGQNVAATLTAIYSRFYFRYTTKAASGDETITSASSKFELRLNSAGKLSFYDRTNTLKSTGTKVLESDIWYRIELHIVNGSSGTYEVRIDGITDLSGSADVANTQFTGLFVGKPVNRNSNPVLYYYDDLAIDSSDWIGESFVAALRPAAVGTYDAFSNFGGINKVSSVMNNDGDTTYIYSSNSNTLQSFTVESPASRGITGVIKAVKAISTQRYPATSASARAFIKSNGTNSFVTNPGYTASTYAANSKLLLQEPSANADWTISDLNSLEIGVGTNSSASGLTNCTRLIAMVLYTPPAGYPVQLQGMTIPHIRAWQPQRIFGK